MGKNPAQKAKDVENKKKAEGSIKTREKKPAKKKVVASGEAKGITEKKCTVASCKREYRAKGYCNVHYRKWRQGEYGKVRYKSCSDFSCNKPMAQNRHGFCESHFQNYYVKGIAVAKAAPAEKEAAPAADAAKSA